MNRKLLDYRVSLRLKDYDYSQANAYFVTICTKERENILGKIANEKVILSPAGEIAQNCCLEIPDHFKNVILDEFVVMPNHLHVIIFIQDMCRRVACNTPTQNYHSQISPKIDTLSVIVRSYKSAVSKKCKENGLFNFAWQKNYYEHIARSEDKLN